MSDLISRQGMLNRLEEWNTDDPTEKALYNFAWNRTIEQPTIEPEWNNHTVACLLAELFDDTCACNYNGIDEWLPSKCELLDSCPNPVGVACWEQYLKHRAERRTDAED